MTARALLSPSELRVCMLAAGECGLHIRPGG